MTIDVPATVVVVWGIGAIVGIISTPFTLGLMGKRVEMGDDDSFGPIWLWAIWPPIALFAAVALCMWLWADGLNAAGRWLHTSVAKARAAR